MLKYTAMITEQKHVAPATKAEAVAVVVINAGVRLRFKLSSSWRKTQRRLPARRHKRENYLEKIQEDTGAYSGKKV